MEITKIKYLPATNSDLDAIAEIKVRGYKDAYLNILSNTYLSNLTIDKERKHFDKYNLEDFYVAKDNNKVIAFCRIMRNKEINQSYIREIYVEPGLKGFGIGSKLFQFIKNILKNEGFPNMKLDCFEANEKSLHFYRKMGGTEKPGESIKFGDKMYSTIEFEYKL